MEPLQAVEVHKGVFLLKNLVPQEKAQAYCSHLLQPTEVDFAQFETRSFKANPFFAFCQLYATRWRNQDEPAPAEDSVTYVVTSISDNIHKALYGEGGIWANLPGTLHPSSSRFTFNFTNLCLKKMDVLKIIKADLSATVLTRHLIIQEAQT